MWSYAIVKHALKAWAAYTMATEAMMSIRTPARRGCILNYHRVSQLGTWDFTIDSWNVTPQRFFHQVRLLAEEADCISLDKMLRLVQSGPHVKPAVTLAFDDGFANIQHNVLPIIKQHGIPVTVFVVTKYIGSRNPFPFDGWGFRNWKRAPVSNWRPISWMELEDCVESGLVSVGSHSHSHLHGSDCSDEQLEEEAAVSRELLKKYLGSGHGEFYAYPYGLTRHGDVPSAYIQALRRTGYRAAVTTDLGLVSPASNILALPRIEATGQDLPLSLLAKASGLLGPTRLLDQLRRSRRNGISPQLNT